MQYTILTHGGGGGGGEINASGNGDPVGTIMWSVYAIAGIAAAMAVASGIWVPSEKWIAIIACFGAAWAARANLLLKDRK